MDASTKSDCVSVDFTTLEGIGDLIECRDHVLSGIYNKLKPVLTAVEDVRQAEGAMLSEVYLESGSLVMFVKVPRTTGRPEHAVLVMPVAAVDRAEPQMIRTLVSGHLATVPDEE